jgi:rubrerythrin
MIMTASSNRKSFHDLIDRWVGIEENAIDNATDLINRSKNPMLKSMIELIKMDSQKHKRILETIRLNLDSAVTFSTDDLKVVDTLVEKHAMMEKHAVETAEQALEMSSLPIPRFLLAHLLQDERNHDAYVQELNELKAHMAKDT